MTDIATNLGAQRLAGELKRHRHRWARGYINVIGTRQQLDAEVCATCGAVKDEAKSRRGKSSRNRGNRRELELAKALGGTKVGQFGGKADVTTSLLNVQSKVRKAFPNWQWDELAKLPRTGGRLPALIVTDAPGPGVARRSIVVLTLEDFTDLHGKVRP